MNDLKDGLERFLAEVYLSRQDLAVDRLANISDGWESEMYSFILSFGAAASRTEETLILRIYPGDHASEKSQRESAGMRRLFEAGYPVPRICAVDSSGLGYIDQPFVIMEFVDGQVMWFMLAEMPDQASMLLIELYCRLFVRLHTLDWRLFVGEEINKYEDDPYRFVDSWFTQGKEALKRNPVIDLSAVMSWLEERRDQLACPQPSAVHQDFHPGNVLVIDDGIPVVIDWTGFDVSDYRFDLAWALVLVNAYSGKEYRDAILKTYETIKGTQVENIEIFEVFACSRRLFDVFVSLTAGPQRLGMRPEAEKAIREQLFAVERVYQLLVQRTGIVLEDVEEFLLRERNIEGTG